MCGKKALAAFICVLVFFLVMPLAAEEVPEVWHTKDLFYYDDQGLVKRLTTVPKIVAEFDHTVQAEERIQILADPSVTSLFNDPKNIARVFAEFSPQTTPEQILGFLNGLPRKEGIRASPVFLKENMEVLVEGIVVEPKITISSAALKERITRFGEIAIRQITQNGATFTVIIDGIKPPLNILRLANLVHHDSWVRRACPHFVFLHDPIVAQVSVDPISGTVGEVREVRLSVRIFDPAIVLDETRIPSFNEGSFMPLIGSDIARAKRPEDYFIRVLEKRKPREERDSRSRTVTYAWRFKMHDLGENGEWMINPQIISYKKNGEANEVKSNSVTMVVTSLIGSLKIDDMPNPKPIPLRKERPEVTVEVALPVVPSFWYERWIKDPTLFVWYGRRGAMFSGGVAVLAFLLLLWTPLRASVRRRGVRASFLEKMRTLVREACASSSYVMLAEALGETLAAAFPGKLPPHSTLTLVESDSEVKNALEPVWGSVVIIFDELGERHKSGFTPKSQKMACLAEHFEIVLGHLEDRISPVRQEEV